MWILSAIDRACHLPIHLEGFQSNAFPRWVVFADMVLKSPVNK